MGAPELLVRPETHHLRLVLYLAPHMTCRNTYLSLLAGFLDKTPNTTFNTIERDPCRNLAEKRPVVPVLASTLANQARHGYRHRAPSTDEVSSLGSSSCDQSDQLMFDKDNGAIPCAHLFLPTCMT